MDSVSTLLEELMVKFLTILPNAIFAVIIFILAVYLSAVLSRAVCRGLEKRGTDHEAKLVITTITRWTVIIAGVFWGLKQLGFDLSAFLVSLGVVGFTIGFALQDISKNFVAGMLLLIQQPFDIGNAIEVADYSGTVKNVDLRATEILTFDGQTVLIPNTDVYTSAIKNFSREVNRRLDITTGVAYDTDLEFARQTVLEALAGIEGVLADPAPQVVYNNFGESSIDFTLYFWVDTRVLGVLAGKDEAIVAINEAFTARGIEIPYPVQTVLTRQST